MFCSKCGNQVADDAAVCSRCGNQLKEITTVGNAPQNHNVPKCTNCGHIGETQPGPLFRKNDLIWIVLLMFLAGGGFIYLAYILITRSDPKKREQICPHCKSVNRATYWY